MLAVRRHQSVLGGGTMKQRGLRSEGEAGAKEPGGLGLSVHAGQAEETCWGSGRTCKLGFKPHTEAKTLCCESRDT